MTPYVRQDVSHDNPHETSSDGSDSVANTLPALCDSAQEFLSKSHDFIIIGGGTAGLAVAARLSEDPNVLVGVLEAGKSRLDDPLVDTPGAFSHLLGNPEYDYGFKSVPQEGNRGVVHHVSRGKALGGSSAINYMMYVRGSDADYDDWATLVGDPMWSSKALKPYVRKHQTLEKLDESILDRADYPHVGENHGTEGPVRTSFNDSSLPIDSITIKALDEAAGLSKKPTDPWSGDHIGFYNGLGAVARSGPHKGKRSYSARGYFQGNASRSNLQALCEAQVLKILLEDGIAKGVEFVHRGKSQTVYAKKEIILCGGVIHSPQILELSGIGDSKSLAQAGIECKLNLPGVGENLQDHVVTAINLELKPGNITSDILGDPQVMEQATKALLEQQSGPLTAIAGVQGFFPYKLLVPSDELEQVVQSIRKTQDDSAKSPFYKRQLDLVIAHLESDKSANLQYIMLPLGADFEHGVQTQKLFPPPDNNRPHQMVLASCLQYPVSRGSVHVTTSDPSVHPRIDPGYLNHPADVTVAAAGLHFIHKATKTSQLAPIVLSRTYPPASRNLDNATDREEAVKDWIMGEYHLMGTCAMGEVVDSRLRVKGVKGLRIVDASVFPNNVSGNICSSVYTVAEKAADIIKEDWANECRPLQA